jgi:hypothetical protein
MRRLPFARLVRLMPMVFLLSVHAAAAQTSASQSTPPDPVDEATLRFGPVGLNPALLIRDLGRDNNVFNDPTNPKSDFTATVTPRLEVVTHPGPLKLSWVTTSDYVYYQTYTSERGTNLGNTVKADFDLRAFHPFVGVGFANTRERFNREIDARARHRDQQYSGGFRVQLSEGVFATAGIRQTEYTFDPDAEFRGQSLATTLNRTEEGIEAGGGVNLTPLTSLAVTVSRERARFEFLPERNSQTLRVTPTVSFSPLAILQGTASVGYRRFTAESPQVPDYKGFVATVTLGTTIRERHRLDTTVARDLQYSYEEDVAEYIETGFTAGWNWQITGPIDSRLYGGRSRLHYRSPTLTEGQTDDIAHTFGFSVGWRFSGHLRAGVNGDWRGRDSERSADRTYDNRRIFATLTWGKVS